ncbi:hypothetical protein MHU86_9086 [Fragilaria crotonensis]|nr:hypothetical protein MHU86_9086 [Fragilaria crotonensis]
MPGVPPMCAIIFASKLHKRWVFGFDASASGLEMTKTYKGMRAWENRFQWDLPVMSMALRFQHSAAHQKVAASQVTYWLLCLQASTSLASLITLMGLRLFSYLMVTEAGRFDLKFLQYINTNTTKWNACIGVPYGTSYWQVGDSTEQNGCFKMALTKHKRNLLRRKEECRSEFAIKKIDIVYLVHQAWLQSFARVESNKKAIADRASNIEQSATSPASIAITQKLNLLQGLAGSYLDAIVETRMRDDACNGVNLDEIRRKQKQSAIDAMETGIRVTAGRLVASGSHALGPDLFKKMADREMVRDEEECKKIQKKIENLGPCKTKFQEYELSTKRMIK